MARDINVLTSDLQFPEGPAFDPTGDLWCVDVEAGELVRWNGGTDRYDLGGGPNGLAFTADGDAWVCDNGRDSIRRFDPRTGEASTVLQAIDGTLLDGPNDLAFDRRGALVFTCSGDPDASPEAPAQALCRLAPNRTARRLARDLVFPNGLTFTPSGDELLVAETYANRVVRGLYDPTTSVWGEREHWANIPSPVGPDGMAVDHRGYVYVAVYGRGELAVFDWEGTRIESIQVPGENPTNLAFDPSGELGLVVTESDRGELLSLPNQGPGSSAVPFLG